jgi:hypothetical protein
MTGIVQNKVRQYIDLYSRSAIINILTVIFKDSKNAI